LLCAEYYYGASSRHKIVWNEENLAKNEQMKEDEGYATMKIDEVTCEKLLSLKWRERDAAE
jgi:hypothetical protein